MRGGDRKQPVTTTDTPQGASAAPQPPNRKRPIYRRLWFWIALAAVIVIIAVASSTGGSSTPDPATTPVNPPGNSVSAAPPPSAPAPGPASADAPRTASVGDGVIFTSPAGGTGEVTLNSVRWLTTGEGPLASTPKSGSYLVANVTVKATAGQVSPNPLAFRVVASDGTTTNAYLGAVANQIASNDVPAGRQARGDVAFDVPRGPYTLDYSLFGPPLASFGIG